jgi:hypothetical protein
MTNRQTAAAGKMSVGELFAYAAELETSLFEAKQAASVFAQEARVTRELLNVERAKNGQADDERIDLCLVVERHLEAIIAMIDCGDTVARAQDEYLTIARMARHALSTMLANFRKTYMDSDEPAPRAPYDDGIPF